MIYLTNDGLVEETRLQYFLSSLRNRKYIFNYGDPGRQLAAVQVGTDGTDIINIRKCFLRFGQSYDRCGRINQLSKKREREDDTAILFYHPSTPSKLLSTTTQNTYYQSCLLYTKQDASTAETWDISEKSVLRWSARTVTCSATRPLTATVAHRQ